MMSSTKPEVHNVYRHNAGGGSSHSHWQCA